MININIWKANTTFISKSLLNEVKSIVKNSLTHKITAEEMLFMCNQQLLLKFNIWHRFFFKKIFKGLARHPQISKMLSFATICQALYLRCLWGPWLFLWPCLQNLKFNIRSSLAFYKITLLKIYEDSQGNTSWQGTQGNTHGNSCSFTKKRRYHECFFGDFRTVIF